MGSGFHSNINLDKYIEAEKEDQLLVTTTQFEREMQNNERRNNTQVNSLEEKEEIRSSGKASSVYER